MKKIINEKLGIDLMLVSVAIGIMFFGHLGSESGIILKRCVVYLLIGTFMFGVIILLIVDQQRILMKRKQSKLS